MANSLWTPDHHQICFIFSQTLTPKLNVFKWLQFPLSGIKMPKPVLPWQFPCAQLQLNDSCSSRTQLSCTEPWPYPTYHLWDTGKPCAPQTFSPKLAGTNSWTMNRYYNSNSICEIPNWHHGSYSNLRTQDKGHRKNPQTRHSRLMSCC